MPVLLSGALGEKRRQAVEAGQLFGDQPSREGVTRTVTLTRFKTQCNVGGERLHREKAGVFSGFSAVQKRIKRGRFKNIYIKELP
jgi:hypothetical protein